MPDEYYSDEGCFITELQNDAADADVSVARVRVAIGTRTRWHRLAGITERYLVLEGQGEVETGDAGAREVGPGDVVVIPAAVRQRIANTGDRDLVFLAVCTPRFEPAAYEALD